MDQPSLDLREASCEVPTIDVEARDPRAKDLAARGWIVVDRHGVLEQWCPPDHVEHSLSLVGFFAVAAGLAFAFGVATFGGLIALGRRARAKRGEG